MEPISVVTFNIGSGNDGRAPKKGMIDEFLIKNQPSLLFLQENPWDAKGIENRVPKVKESYEAVAHKHRDATVLYRKDVLQDEGCRELMESFQDVFSRRDQISHLHFSTFKNRASFSKLIEINTGMSFVAISWHGKRNDLPDPLQEEMNNFEDLLLVIKNINSRTSLPVVLGGDFNIRLDIVNEFLENHGLEVYNYEPRNRQTIIDFFVVTRDVELSNVRAYGDYMKLYMFADEQRGRDFKVFDNDPVQAKISFRSPHQQERSRRHAPANDEASEVTCAVGDLNIS